MILKMPKLLETLLNRLLNCNPDYFDHLQGVAGVSLSLKLTDLPVKMTLIFHHSYIEVTSVSADPQLALAGKLMDFICFAARAQKRQQFLQEERIQFQGDLAALEQIQKFLSHFNFKILLLLPTTKIKRFFENQIEYWQEEQQILASPVLFDHFTDEVLLLQQDLDRLSVRLKSLGDRSLLQ